MGISKFLAVAANTVSGNPEPSVGVVVATGLIIVFGVLVLLYLLTYPTRASEPLAAPPA